MTRAEKLNKFTRISMVLSLVLKETSFSHQENREIFSKIMSHVEDLAGEKFTFEEMKEESINLANEALLLEKGSQTLQKNIIYNI